jgi:hypothetical protein
MLIQLRLTREQDTRTRTRTRMEELPLGYRFYPTEEELISFYLHNKLGGGRQERLQRVIPDISIYDIEPWDLPSKKPHLNLFYFVLLMIN